MSMAVALALLLSLVGPQRNALLVGYGVDDEDKKLSGRRMKISPILR